MVKGFGGRHGTGGKGGCLGSLMRSAAVARKGRWLLGFRLFRVKGVSTVMRIRVWGMSVVV